MAYTQNIIDLELTDSLKNEGTVSSFEIDRKYKNIIVGLKDTNGNKKIIFRIYPTEWIKTKKKFDQTSRENGLQKELSERIFDFVNNNYKQIISVLSDGEDIDKKDKGSSISKDLDSLARESIILLFKDQRSTSYAYVRINSKNGQREHKEAISIESKRFERYLARLYSYKYGKIPNIETINNVVLGLASDVEFDYNTISLNIRVGWKDPTRNDTICYDLTDENWRYVIISKNYGWKIIDTKNDDDENNRPVFVRYKTQNPQVEPSRDYEPDIFDIFFKLTNIKTEDDIKLLKVYIIGLFIPDIPRVILQLFGEGGSGKTLFLMLVKMLVDPGKPKLLTISGDKNEFIQQLAHNYLLYYDNLKYEPKWLSDEVCKASTGIGNTKRMLYTNDEDLIFEYRRNIALSAINVSLNEPDAMDRSITIELKRIKKENKITEAEILATFEELKPKLLGYILDILVKVLQIKDSIKLDTFPRMADFALWGEAIARAMGYKPLEFINIYYENIGKQNIVVIDSNPLGITITKFCNGSLSTSKDNEKKLEWSGFTKDFLKELEDIASNNNIDTKSKFWPKSTNSLTRRIRKISSNLLEGYEIDTIFGRDNDNVSTIRITKNKNNNCFVQEDTKNTSRTSGPPETPKSCLTSSKNSGDSETSSEIISPEFLHENRSQNGSFRRSGDTGDILDKFGEERDIVFDDISNKDMNTKNQQKHPDTFKTPTISIVYPESKEGVYRIYPNTDIWGCKYCYDKGEKWYILVHRCKKDKREL